MVGGKGASLGGLLLAYVIDVIDHFWPLQAMHQVEHLNVIFWILA